MGQVHTTESPLRPLGELFNKGDDSTLGMDRITKSSLAQTTLPPSKQILKTGQIVQGKIIKLYPNSKAEIQLGSQRMIAQVKASLTIGGKYHFQVQTSDDVIHLKVLGDQLRSEEQLNLKDLLQQLGLKTTKLNMAFIKSLMHGKIPFGKMQLAEAIRLLNSAKEKKLTQNVLREMIAAKLPLTNFVLQALLAKHANGITEQMKALLQPLRLSEDYIQLTERLSQMIESPLHPKASLIKQILTETKCNHPQFFNLLRSSGSIDQSIEFTTWKSHWEAFARQNNITLMNIPTASTQQLNKAVLPFQMNSAEIYQTLDKVIFNKVELQSKGQEMLQQWGNKLTLLSQPMPEKEFIVLKQQITQEIMPFLTTKQQDSLLAILKNDVLHLPQLLKTLETFSSNQDMANLEAYLTKVNQDKGLLAATPKEQFLSQINQTLRFTGLGYENQLLNSDIVQQSHTVKAMLLHMLQKSDGDIHDRGQQLLHFINGMQITAVNEVNHFIQANLQIPCERIGLSSDVELKFEGNKTKNGEINPDYCRVIFYLELSYLKKTVIDMNINKRAVTVIIFNDTEQLKNESSVIQPLLKQGLNALDYYLSALTFKPLKQIIEAEVTNFNKPSELTYQGVDYRI